MVKKIIPLLSLGGLLKREFNGFWDHFAPALRALGVKCFLIHTLAFSCAFAGIESDFFRACLNGNETEVVSLYEKGGKSLIFARDRESNTALHIACCSKKGGNKKQIVAFLIANKANINTQNRFKSTPLIIAVSNGNYEAVELLLKCASLKPNLQDHHGYSPLHQGVVNRMPPMIRLLLSHPKINPNFGTADGSSPLHFASMYGYVEEAKALIDDPRTDLNVAQHDANYGGATPLHFAAMQGEAEIVRMMLTRGGVDIHATLTQGLYAGFTPLHFATMNPDTVSVFETIKILLNAGANPKKKCNVGKTPMDLTQVSIIKSLLKNPKTQLKSQ